MVSKKAFKAYEFQRKLFPVSNEPNIYNNNLSVVKKIEKIEDPKFDYIKQFMEEKNSKVKINYEKLFWLLSIRIFFLALVLFVLYQLISL
jgi:hypothetical protein